MSEAISIETEATLVMPGDVGQIFHAFTAAVVLRAFVSDEPVGSVEEILAGAHKLNVKGGEAIPEGGVSLPPSSIAIALVRNTGAVPVMIKGTWTVDALSAAPAGLPIAVVPPSAAVPSAMVPSAVPGAVLPRAVLKPPDPDVGTWKKLEDLAKEMVVLGERAKTGTVRVVAPGTNERAVLLVHNEILLLIGLVRTGRPIEESSKWAIVRKLEEAAKT